MSKNENASASGEISIARGVIVACQNRKDHCSCLNGNRLKKLVGVLWRLGLADLNFISTCHVRQDGFSVEAGERKRMESSVA